MKPEPDKIAMAAATHAFPTPEKDNPWGDIYASERRDLADVIARRMQPLVEEIDALRAKLLTAERERDEANDYLKSRVICGLGEGTFVAVDPWAKKRIEDIIAQLAAAKEDGERLASAVHEYLRINDSKGGEDYDGSLAPLRNAARQHKEDAS